MMPLQFPAYGMLTKENKKMKSNNKTRLRMQELLDTNPKEFHEKLEESFGRLEKLYSERDETKFAEDLISKINNYWTKLNYLKIPSTPNYKDIQRSVIKNIHILNLLKNYIKEKNEIDIQNVLQPVGDDLGVKEDILYHHEDSIEIEKENMKEDNSIMKLENIV